MWLKENHTTISVSDMEKAFAFYRDLMGMKVRMDTGPTPRPNNPFMEKLFDMTGITWRVAQLDYEDSYVLELIQWHTPTPKPFPSDSKPNDLGVHWHCLYHTDVDGIYQKLKAGGVRFISEPQEFVPGVKSVFCLDPDGNWIEIHSPRH